MKLSIILVFLLSCSGFARAAVGQIYLHDFTDPSVDGSRGYVIEHPENEEFPQDITPIGDFNGDGYQDFAVSNPSVNFQDGGEIFIFWGRPDAPPFFDSTTLRPENGGNPQAGIRIVDSDVYSTLGWSMDNVGDINGDGIDDLGIGSPEWLVGPGFAFVLFGRDSSHPFPEELDLANLTNDSQWGVRFVGENLHSATGVKIVRLGDIDGDMHDDFYILSQDTSPLDSSVVNFRAYVIYGRGANNPFSSSIILLQELLPENGGDGSLGFIIGSSQSQLYIFNAVGIDINNDGLNDIVQDTNGDVGGEFNEFIIFGKPRTSRNPVVDINEIRTAIKPSPLGVTLISDYSYNCIRSYGGVVDLDNDGINDLVSYCDSRTSNPNVHKVFVLWGGEFWSNTLNFHYESLLQESGGDGSRGFVIRSTSYSAAMAFTRKNGDINGDGIDDLILTSTYITDFGNQTILDDITQDVIYVIYGRLSKSSWPIMLEMSDFQEDSEVMDNIGFSIRGEPVPYRSPNPYREFAGAVGLISPDIDGDGSKDIILGTIPGGNGDPYFSKVYVIYGGSDHLPLPTDVVGAQAVAVPSMGIFQGLTLICLILVWGVFRINEFNDSHRF